jgi:hypothetical protein
VVHVRRLLDIVACTTSFGPSATSKENLKSDSTKNAPGAQDKGAPASTTKSTTTQAQGPAAKQEAAMEEEGEMSHAFPKLGTFYEFFSLSHLTPPLQCTSLSLSLPLCMCVYRLFTVLARCWEGSERKCLNLFLLVNIVAYFPNHC